MVFKFTPFATKIRKMINFFVQLMIIAQESICSIAHFGGNNALFKEYKNKKASLFTGEEIKVFTRTGFKIKKTKVLIL